MGRVTCKLPAASRGLAVAVTARCSLMAMVSGAARRQATRSLHEDGDGPVWLRTSISGVCPKASSLFWASTTRTEKMAIVVVAGSKSLACRLNGPPIVSAWATSFSAIISDTLAAPWKSVFGPLMSIR